MAFMGSTLPPPARRVLITDTDELALTRGLQRAEQEPTWKVAFGVSDTMSADFGDLPIADVVMAVGLTHHLRFSQGYHFSEIASRLSSLTRRVLITEFMPWGLRVDKAPTDLPSHYNLETFLDNLSRRFSSVEIVPSNTDETGQPKVLIRCTK